MSAAPATTPTAAAPTLDERLGRVCVGVRRDLEISRHVFRGSPCYVIRDPVTFQSHRLEPEDYHVLMSIDPGKTLAETFLGLVEEGEFEPDEQEHFYEFVLSLHHLGFLRLPISDEKALFRRHQARAAARRRQRVAGILFLQIPLINPDAFLARTLPLVRWVFSRAFFAVWLAVVASAVMLARRNWAALSEPIGGLLASENVPVLWATLILLKALHEFGHAYACKHFGGHVPEMGAYVIMFTPCAYVDATASWGFTRRLHRLIVSLAGMYVELFVAALAVFVWALTPPSLLNSIAYNVVFLASSVTVLFNANPLMRYDGYYVLSDLLGVPNLRQRSSEYLAALTKRAFFGIPLANAPDTWSLRAVLACFGVGAALYRVTILLAIVAVVARKLPFIGYGLGLAYFAFMSYGLVSKLARYLWFASETAAVRSRAIAYSVVLFAALPLVVALVPIPGSLTAGGVVAAENETVVRAESPGFVEHVAIRPGQMVPAGETLATLTNASLEEQVARQESELAAADIRHAAMLASDVAAAQTESRRAAAHRASLAHAERRVSDLTLTSLSAGRVVAGLQPEDVGRYLSAGDAVATIASGAWEVRAVLSADDVALCMPKVGDQAEFRARGAADAPLAGRVKRVNPHASRTVEIPALTHLAGGEIAVEAHSGAASQPYVEVIIALDQAPRTTVEHGQTGVVRLNMPAEPLGKKLYRALVRFSNRMLLS